MTIRPMLPGVVTSGSRTRKGGLFVKLNLFVRNAFRIWRQTSEIALIQDYKKTEAKQRLLSDIRASNVPISGGAVAMAVMGKPYNERKDAGRALWPG